MGKSLVIAEKYLAACDIADALGCTERKAGYIEGKKYIITWADGHLIGFQYPEEYNPTYKEWKLEQLPLKFEPQKALVVLPEKRKQFEIVKKLIQGSETDLIINAGDAGREGYLIQHRIYEMAENKKPVKVLWASALTKEAILEAFENLHEEREFVNILEEAEARAEKDYILGMNYSRLLTLKCSKDLTLPYGRCMTTLLNLIVQREKAMAEFIPEKSYVIEIEYKGGIKGELVDLEGKQLVFDDDHTAQSVLAELGDIKEGIVELVEVKEKHEMAPSLYSLPRLQAQMGSKYKYSPSQTLQIVQNLYERHKIISYPRTDSCYLPLSMVDKVERNLASCMFGKFKTALNRSCKEDIRADGKYFNDRDIKDHHALVPVPNRKMSEIYMRLTEDEKNVFDEIVYSFFGIFCRPRVTHSTTMQVFVNGYLFRSTNSIEIDPGYKLLKSAETEENAEDTFWKSVEVGTTIPISEKKVKERVSSPPARYTVGTITKLMESYKIGTPATMAATIEKLLDEKRPFLILKDGKYYSTPYGRMYISVVPEELKRPELTELMEEELKLIREGSYTKDEMIANTMVELQKNLELTDYKKMSFQRSVKVKKASKENYKRKRRGYFG